MKSLYAQYILEREGKQIIEDERGFATYVFLPDLQAVYLEDVFVLPEFRRSGAASSFADRVIAVGVANHCKFIVTTVSPKANGSTESLKVILNYGFKLESSDTLGIYFRKQIGSI